jgi:hypothetical protein
MEEKELRKNPDIHFQQNMESFDRRFKDRREETRAGFTYISTVGWICRREKSRREDDDQ